MPALFDFLVPKVEVGATSHFTLSEAAFQHALQELATKPGVRASTGQPASFRVQGSVFADLVSVTAVTRGKPNPDHYEKVGFKLSVAHLPDGRIQLSASERVIFGTKKEVAAISAAFRTRLDSLLNLIGSIQSPAV